MTIQARQRAHRLGRVAEAMRSLAPATGRLLDPGPTLYKTKLGEIDIVARRGGVLAFVEVKARRDVTLAADALGGRQFGRVARAASLFVARHPHFAAHSVRFDAMLVSGFWPRHLPDVWQAPE